MYWSFQINSRLRQNVKKQCFYAFTGDNRLEAGLKRDEGRGDLRGDLRGDPRLNYLLQNEFGEIRGDLRGDSSK